MTDLRPIIPRQPAPPLVAPLAGGGVYDLALDQPRLFSMLSSTGACIASNATPIWWSWTPCCTNSKRAA